MNWLDFREPFNAWTHGAWLLLSLPATLLLWRLSRGHRVKQFSLTVFGLSLSLCYAGSTLYHGVRLPPEELEPFATLDYIGIYLLIAGTTTPLALVVLRGPWQWGTLGITWLVTAGGIALRLAAVEISRLHSTGIYLAMGWAVSLSYFELARIVSYRAIWPALLGGLLYSAGALLNHHHWPTLWPGVFSAHELSHLFVMAASASHYWLMIRVVVPSQRRASRRWTTDLGASYGAENHAESIQAVAFDLDMSG